MTTMQILSLLFLSVPPATSLVVVDPLSCWGCRPTGAQGFMSMDWHSKRLTSSVFPGRAGRSNPLDSAHDMMTSRTNSLILHVASMTDADLLYYPRRRTVDSLFRAIESIKAIGINTNQFWHKRVPKPFRFFMSGRVGDVVFYMCERRLSFLLSALIASSWLPSSSPLFQFVTASQGTLSYLGGSLLRIVPQHFLHALLVYGLDSINTRKKYTQTPAWNERKR